MKTNKKQNNKGFTLVETMVAVFILAMTISVMLGLTANSIFNARYARNEIIANYLLQEIADHIRNERDTLVFQRDNTDDGWIAFLNKYGYNDGSGSGVCFDSLSSKTGGCYFEPRDVAVPPLACNNSPVSFGSIHCPILNFDENATNDDFYTYRTGTGVVPSNFKRQVLMQVDPSKNEGDELDVRINLEWRNGNVSKVRSLQMTLLNWQN